MIEGKDSSSFLFVTTRSSRLFIFHPVVQYAHRQKRLFFRRRTFHRYHFARHLRWTQASLILVFLTQSVVINWNRGRFQLPNIKETFSRSPFFKAIYWIPHRSLGWLMVSSTGFGNTPGFSQSRMEKIFRTYLRRFVFWVGKVILSLLKDKSDFTDGPTIFNKDTWISISQDSVS